MRQFKAEKPPETTYLGAPIPQDLFDAIAAISKRRGVSRSEFMRQALVFALKYSTEREAVAYTVKRETSNA